VSRVAHDRRGMDGLSTSLDRLKGSFLGRFLRGVLDLGAVDRALALSSKLFVAILPLSILCTAVVSGAEFSTQLINRFGLTGAGAQAAESLFASPAQVQGGIGFLGAAVLVSSILSFARALERVYLDCWGLAPIQPSALRRRLTWLAGLLVYVVVLSPVRTALAEADAVHATRFAAAVGAAALFLWTPRVLLAGRVPWRNLVPTAIVTGGAMLVLGFGSAIVMPGMLSHNTERYGLIGFTFSLVTWLFAAALVVIASAVLGRLLDEERRGPGVGLPQPVEATRIG
jgi:hypothetical protein